MSPAANELRQGFLHGDPSVFIGPTAATSIGWLQHPAIYREGALHDFAAMIPRRHSRTIVLGMGGSSGGARFFAQNREGIDLLVVDTSNPDDIAAIDFSKANVVASSKSGTTIETQCLLAHALAHGLDVADLVIITDPSSPFEELGRSLGATVILGDPNTGGRFSALSPFGLVPALYAGWSVEELDEILATNAVTAELVDEAILYAGKLLDAAEKTPLTLQLALNPLVDGGALWLEQLIAETTGKDGTGVVPVVGLAGVEPTHNRVMFWHLVAASLAHLLGVDPFSQPNVEAAKRRTIALLEGDTFTQPMAKLSDEELRAFVRAPLSTVLFYGPTAETGRMVSVLEQLRPGVELLASGIGPAYLHSTGQLFKGGPAGMSFLEVIIRPKTSPLRIAGRRYSFHDLHAAQAYGDYLALQEAGFSVNRIEVDEAEDLLGLFDR
jgi:hypothetical protein